MRMSKGSWGLGVLLVLAVACGGSDDPQEGEATESGSPDQAGAVCEVPGDCYPEVDPADLAGAALCLDRVPEGYCTHQCTDDADCCAVDGECLTDLPQVCSPFESTGMNMCFLSCESADVASAGLDDAEEFCQQEVSPYFICRSSGGGSNNRKICVPGDCGVGAACVEDADCANGLACDDAWEGGYCGARGCETNADCPTDSLCIADGDSSYCARTCAGPTDCTFCRPDGVAAECRGDVDHADGSDTPVCVATHT